MSRLKPSKSSEHREIMKKPGDPGFFFGCLTELVRLRLYRFRLGLPGIVGHSLLSRLFQEYP
ncbi:MAG: hypothetical protein Q8K35_08460 [Thiobacillus sp.]|nr:hypothetical protein [Thiobacillus sp.]